MISRSFWKVLKVVRKVARYSFLGSQPSILFKSKGNEVTIEDFGKREKVVKEYKDPLSALEELMQQYQPRQC